MRQIILISIFLMPITLAAQSSVSTTEFTEEIKKFDYSIVLTADSIWADDYQFLSRLEPFGYFGENYQRINVKLISVIKDELNPLEYFVYGKTRLLGKVAEFQGTIKITKCSIYDESDVPNYKQGFIEADYILYEDPKDSKTGKFQGKLHSNFFVNNDGELGYDALMLAADGFSNNQFEGTWESYSTNKVYTCNWGDYRIPNSENLDTGVGEIGIEEKYWDRGWRSWEVSKGYGTNATKDEIEAARKIEREKWWK